MWPGGPPSCLYGLGLRVHGWVENCSAARMCGQSGCEVHVQLEGLRAANIKSIARPKTASCFPTLQVPLLVVSDEALDLQLLAAAACAALLLGW